MKRKGRIESGRVSLGERDKGFCVQIVFNVMAMMGLPRIIAPCPKIIVRHRQADPGPLGL